MPITYNSELVLPHSQFQENVSLPRFQAEIYGNTNGKWVILGNGFWVAEGFITASHVVYDVDRLLLKRDNLEVEIKRDDFEFVHGDIAIYKISERETQKLYMSRAKLSSAVMVDGGGLMAQVVALGKRSFGFLTPHQELGYCVYGGSTIAGFSGSPYYINNTIYGMHLGGDIQNVGYQAAWLRTFLKNSTVVKLAPGMINEDSAEWLTEKALRCNDMKYKRSPYDPDEYFVEVGGTTHRVDGEVMYKLLDAVDCREDDYDFSYLPESTTKVETPVVSSLPLCPRGAMDFDDSKNLIRVPAVNAGAHGKERVQEDAPKNVKPTSNPTAWSSQTLLAPSHMESRRSTLVPQNAASTSTPRSRRRSTIQKLRQRIVSLQQRCEAMQPGQQISPQPGTSKNGSKPSLGQR
nr:MAG: RNA-dependent RNA polymerase [Riboviria sp.]